MTAYRIVGAMFDHRFTENEDRSTGRMRWRSIEVWQSEGIDFDGQDVTRFYAQAPGITAISTKSYEDALERLHDRAQRVLTDLGTHARPGQARLPDPGEDGAQ